MSKALMTGVTVRIAIQVVDPTRFEQAGTANQPVDLVALRQEELGEVRSGPGRWRWPVKAGATGQVVVVVVEEEPRLGLVRADAKYLLPTEVGELCGNALKARERLGWRPAPRSGTLCA